MDLRINYDETIAVGQNVVTKGGEFQDLLNKIKSVNNELRTYWEGQDASKYTEKVGQDAESMQKLCNTINEMGEFLIKVGEAYRNVSENNTLN